MAANAIKIQPEKLNDTDLTVKCLFFVDVIMARALSILTISFPNCLTT